jgi:FAD/FMN-containing dehydrogenase
VIDLSLMKDVLVDVQRQTALASAGVKLGELIRATEQHGLVTPVGTASDTGIAGLTLGGGFGFLTGKYGLTCDNVLSYHLVTAEGVEVRASATENQDLYWGLRGGGGNFGVVTTFEYQLHPQQGVLGGMLIHPMAKAGEVLRYYREICEQAPDELTIYAALITSPDGHPVIAMLPCYSGDQREGERILEPIRKFGPPLADMIKPMSYLEMISLLDAGFPAGINYYDKGWMLKDLSDSAIEVAIETAKLRTSPLSVVLIQQAHGAATRVSMEATAFSARKSNYGPVLVACWQDGPAEPHIEWARKGHAAFKPYSIDEMYVNFISTEEQPLVPSAYGSNYARLVELKRRYDPQNVFRRNANILP